MRVVHAPLAVNVAANSKGMRLVSPDISDQSHAEVTITPSSLRSYQYCVEQNDAFVMFWPAARKSIARTHGSHEMPAAIKQNRECENKLEGNYTEFEAVGIQRACEK